MSFCPKITLPSRRQAVDLLIIIKMMRFFAEGRHNHHAVLGRVLKFQIKQKLCAFLFKIIDMPIDFPLRYRW